MWKSQRPVPGKDQSQLRRSCIIAKGWRKELTNSNPLLSILFRSNLSHFRQAHTYQHTQMHREGTKNKLQKKNLRVKLVCLIPSETRPDVLNHIFKYDTRSMSNSFHQSTNIM